MRILIVLLTLSVQLFSPAKGETITLSGRVIAENVYARDDGEHVDQTLIMELTDKSGKTRRRDTRLVRKEYGDVHKTLITIRSPSALKGTSFLTFDYQNATRDDDQWLYLPAMRRERRISASDRGAYFLGTDFTYEDMKERTRLSLHDFEFALIDRAVEGASDLRWIEALPKSESTAHELGYGKIEALVDTSTWMYQRLVYWDVALNPLKEITLSDIAKIDGIVTAQTIRCENLKTGHTTTFQFTDIDYASPIDDRLFTVAAMRRGLR